MLAIIEVMANVSAIIVAGATILAPTATILAPMAMAAGIAPRLGPGRAIVLALHSRLVSARTTLSERTAEVGKLREMAANVADDRYCVVVGPKGVGKELLRSVCTRLRCGDV